MPQTNARPNKILVVDDESKMLHSVERVLAPHYAVTTARLPHQALECARKERPDLAVLDIRMAEMDGFELMHEGKSIRAVVEF